MDTTLIIPLALATHHGGKPGVSKPRASTHHKQGAVAVRRANNSLSGSGVAVAIAPARTTGFGSFVVQLPAQQKLVKHLLCADSSCELT